MSPKLQALGYVEVETRAPSILGPAGTRFRGHQFRYSTLESDGAEALPHLYSVRPKWGAEFEEGYARANLVASYVHAHWASNPSIAEVIRARLRNRASPRNEARQDHHDPGHRVLGRQESDRRRAMPNLSRRRILGCAIQVAKHGAQFLRHPRRPRNRPRASSAGRGRGHRADRRNESDSAQARAGDALTGSGARKAHRQHALERILRDDAVAARDHPHLQSRRCARVTTSWLSRAPAVPRK